MKSIIAAVVTCAVLFGASMMVTKMMTEPTDAELAEAELETTPVEETSGEPKLNTSQVSITLRPEEHPVTVEAVMQMSDSIKKMEEQLAEREIRVRKKEQRVNLLFDDLATEQQELRSFSMGIDAKVENLKSLTVALQAKLDELDAKKIELEALAKKAGEDDASKQKEVDDTANAIKSWFDQLSPEQAADYLKNFANQGKLEMAASVLQKMPDRQKSKIIGAMNDPVLIQQLIDAVRPKSAAGN